jgi:hypothetical protein
LLEGPVAADVPLDLGKQQAALQRDEDCGASSLWSAAALI